MQCGCRELCVRAYDNMLQNEKRQIEFVHNVKILAISTLCVYPADKV